MDKKELKIIKSAFIRYLEGRIPDWLVPAEKFFSSFNTGLKSFLKNKGISLSNILEEQDIDKLEQWKSALQHSDNYVYDARRKPSKRLEGIKYYIAFLQEQQSNSIGFSDQVNSNVVEEENYNDILDYVEGEDTDTESKRYERSKKARERCIKEYGYKCYVCQFDFEAVYGKELGEGFIEVHHKVSIAQRAQREGAYHFNPITDLVPLCSNCHSMVHRKRGEVLDVDDLKKRYNEIKQKIQK